MLELWFQFHWFLYGYYWQYVFIGIGNGLAPDKRQAIIWINDCGAYWRSCVMGLRWVKLRFCLNMKVHKCNVSPFVINHKWHFRINESWRAIWCNRLNKFKWDLHKQVHDIWVSIQIVAQSRVRLNYLSTCKLQGLHNWSLWMDSNIPHTLKGECNYLSMEGLKLNHVGERGPW